MTEEFVLENYINEVDEIGNLYQHLIPAKYVKYFLQLLKQDFNIGRKNFIREEIYEILENRAGKSLFNTHPKEQTKSFDGSYNLQTALKNDNRLQTDIVNNEAENKTAPEGVKGCGKMFEKRNNLNGWTYGQCGNIGLCNECKKKQEEKNESSFNP